MHSVVFHLPFLAAFVAAVSGDINKSCPKGVLKTTDTFYLQEWNGTCFHFVLHQKKAYSDANRDCMRHGGTLALPKTWELNNFLTDSLLNYYGKYNEVWIGLHDKKKDFTFVWEDHTALDWGNFAKGNGPLRHPYSPGAAVEDCVALDPDDDGLWHDYQCESGLIAYVTWASYKKFYICQYQQHSGDSKTVEDQIKPEKGDRPDSTGKATPPSKIQDDKETVTAAQPSEDKKENDKIVQGSQEITEGKDESVDPMHVVIDDGCPPFECELPCGMAGYQRDENDCQLCKCYE